MKFRPATMADADRLFQWRNDPATRSASIQYDLVDCVNHHAWLTERLALPEPMLYIAEVEGFPVGTFRIDDGFISYTIAPEMRGRGFATAMLRVAHDAYGPLIAEIYPDNVASIKAAEKAGMKVVLLTREKKKK